MATITREKIAKTNAKLANGFTVDIMSALRGERMYSKDFVMPDGRTAQADVYYTSRYNRETGKEDTFPVVNFNYYSADGAFRKSCGLGWTMKMRNEPVTRKTEKMLVELTKELDDIACINFMVGLTSKYENPLA